MALISLLVFVSLAEPRSGLLLGLAGPRRARFSLGGRAGELLMWMLFRYRRNLLRAVTVPGARHPVDPGRHLRKRFLSGRMPLLIWTMREPNLRINYNKPKSVDHVHCGGALHHRQLAHRYVDSGPLVRHHSLLLRLFYSNLGLPVQLSRHHPQYSLCAVGHSQPRSIVRARRLRLSL